MSLIQFESHTSLNVGGASQSALLNKSGIISMSNPFKSVDTRKPQLKSAQQPAQFKRKVVPEQLAPSGGRTPSMMDESVRRNESAVTPSDNSKIRHDSRASFVKDNSQNSSA